MPTAAFTILVSNAHRDSDNQIVVPYPDLDLKSAPIIITTPFYYATPGSNSFREAEHSPTVTKVCLRYATIADANEGTSYFINVLVIDVDELASEGSSWGVADKKSKLVSSVPLPFDLLQVEGDGVLWERSVNFLTPFWNGSREAVSYVETVNPPGATPPADPNVIMTRSYNAAETYFVNRLGVVKGWSENPFRRQQGSLSFYDTQALYAAKRDADQSLHVPWESEFLTTPVVFLTPQWVGKEGYLRYPETLIGVDRLGCNLASKNAGPDYYVGVLAMPHGRPRVLGSYYQDAFAKFSDHFYGHKAQLGKNKVQLDQIVLEGAEAGNLANLPFNDRPSISIGKAEQLLDVEQKMIQVVVDFADIILTVIGITEFDKAKSAMAKELVAFVQSTKDYSEVVNACHPFAFSSGPHGRSTAFLMLKVAEYFYENNIYHMALVALGQTKSWIGWVEDGLTILAQAAVIAGASVATEGVALEVLVPAWVRRLILVIDEVEHGAELMQHCQELIKAWDKYQSSGN